MYYSTGPHYCPECPKWKNRLGKERSREVDLIESNYSGTGEDVVSCSKCGKAWFIRYKVDEYHRAEDWDGETQEERAESERKRKEEIKQKEIADAQATLLKYGITAQSSDET